MKRPVLLGYQLITGFSDTSTGLLLILAPALTLRLMHLQAASGALPFLSYIGSFVLSVGLACLYGGLLATRAASSQKLEVVWVLTAITRAIVAIFLISSVLSGALESGWITVAAFDGVLALVQTFGLSRGWLADVTS